MSLAKEIESIASCAKEASRQLAKASPASKNLFLRKLGDLLVERRQEILAANSLDIEVATKNNLDAPRLDRLTLTHKIIEEMRSACLMVAEFADPIGTISEQWQRPNGILVGRMSIPLGVIAMIYEARPNVTIDSAILCLKAGNAVILRGGSEAINSNKCLVSILKDALTLAKLPATATQFIESTEHESVNILATLNQYIDVIIPRGGRNLVQTVQKLATMPVLKHDCGVCHLYVDASANIEQTLDIIQNSKMQRPGVCNALECLLVNSSIAEQFLPLLEAKLAGVELRACPKSLKLLSPKAVAAKDDDWGMEFHALILAVRIVENMDEAIAHIERYGSQHTEIICTDNYTLSQRFIREVDASMVGVNVSTRFNDGGQLGLGAEIGISTSKLHAYGSMGVMELTSKRFVVLGQGQVRI